MGYDERNFDANRSSRVMASQFTSNGRVVDNLGAFTQGGFANRVPFSNRNNMVGPNSLNSRFNGHGFGNSRGTSLLKRKEGIGKRGIKNKMIKLTFFC